MWPMGVVVVEVLDEYGLEVAAAQDEKPIEALSTYGADEAFGDGVRRGARTGVLMIRMPSATKTASKEKVNLVSRSRIKNLAGDVRSVIPKQKFRACWVTQVQVGYAVTPARWTIRVSSSTKNRT